MYINSSTSSAVYWWHPSAWLRVTGADAATFLQGQFTNDLRALETRPAVYGLWLTVKGKVLADSFVLRGARPEEFWIGSYFSPAAVIRERLESYIIADDVAIEDVTAEWSAVSLLDSPAEFVEAREGFVLPGRRASVPGIEWVFPRSRADAMRARLGNHRELTAEEMTQLRIAAGIPAVPTDVGPADLPNEAGLETDAISYAKGCYLGQEVMARLKSMGQVRRRLQRVRGVGGEFPTLPAPVFAGARHVGELRSAVPDGAGWIGLAMLSLVNVTADAELGFAANGPVALRLVNAK